jgi:predicted ester cyclase
MPLPIELVTTFYSKCLTVGPRFDLNGTLTTLFHEAFLSFGSDGLEPRAPFIKKIQEIWERVPNLKWDIEEVFECGNQVVARCRVTGTPTGPFLGLETDGTRSFKIMAINTHTVSGDRIVKMHHGEDWGAAIRQLKK